MNLAMGHNGCKHGWAGLKIIQDTIKKRGLAALYLNVDIMDRRHASENEIKRQITDFMRSALYREKNLVKKQEQPPYMLVNSPNTEQF